MAHITSVLVSAFPPFPTLTLSAPADTSLASLYDLLADRYPQLPPLTSDNLDLVLSPHSGPIPSPETQLSALLEEEDDSLITLRLIPRLRGGKGGFGSQLRAAGGRMSSQKTSNNDSCRDLTGRRLSTIKEAKRLAEYIESEPIRKKAEQEAKRAKLEALEKKLAMQSDGAGPSEPSVGTKRRLEDTEYVEQSKELVENVKNAVTVAMLKKKKKAKTASAASSSGTSSGATKSVDTQKVPESSAIAPVAAATGVASA
ncbi:SDE2 family protein [Abortiporus biennis]